VNQTAGDSYVSSSVKRQANERKGAPKQEILGCQLRTLSIQDGSLTLSLRISTAC